MGKCYGQLSLEERVEIYRLHAGGRSQNQIAAVLNRAASTISRELQRNSQPSKVWPGGYEPVRAQQLADRRRRWDGRFKLARQPDLRDCVGKSLAMGHSPEQIAGRLALEHGRVIISHESIYRFIYHRTAQKDYWHRLLPRHKLKRGHRRRPGGNPASFIKQRRPTTEPSSPNITDFTRPSVSKPSSAIPTVPGKRVAWKIPSGAYDAHCHAKLTSSLSRQPPSSSTFNASTILHANAWTSRHRPRHSPNSNQSLHFKRDSISPPARA